MRPNFAEATATLKSSQASTWDHELYDQAPIKIGLVLTGGGSHGAFGAGVLEAILPTLNKLGKIAVITGTSAGAVNAVAAGSGLNASGPTEAISRLRETWRRVASNGHPWGRQWRDFTDRYLCLPKNQRWPNFPVSPLELGKVFQNLIPSIPVPSFTAQFVSATVKAVVKDWRSEVQNGKIEISANTSLEKSNEPGKFEHVNLKRENLTPHGVGGSANLRPLGVHYIKDTQNPDHINRCAYDGAYHENGLLDPHYENGVTDCFVIALHDRGHNKLDDGELKHADIHTNILNRMASDSHSLMRFHSIEMKSLGGEIEGLSHIDDSSKLNTDPEFIELLYQAGLKAGQEWLENNLGYICQRSSYLPYPPALQELEKHYA